MKKIFANLLLILPVMFTGCNDFLDIVPDNLATLEIVFQNRSSAEKYLFTCYSFIPEAGKVGTDPGLDVGDEIWYYGQKSTDFTNETTFAIALGLQNSNSPLVDYWNGLNWGKSMFQGMRCCNTLIEYVDRVNDMTVQEKARWKAEVKVLKAYYNFWMMRMYGPFPLMKESLDITASEEDVTVYRDKIDDIVEYSVALINEAYEDLPKYIQNEAAEMGRLTRPAALAIKAKILAYAASPFFNGNTQYAGFVNHLGEPFFNQTEDPGKWQKAADACYEAILAAEEAGHDLYKFSNQSSFILSDEMITELSNRCKVTDRWNIELIFGCGNSGIHDLQVYSQPWLESDYASDDRYFWAKNGTLAPTLAVAETFYTANGVPIDEDPSWDYNGRYDTRTATAAENLYIRDGHTTAKLHFDREPRFYATLGFDGSSWYGLGKKNESDMWYLQAKGKQAAGKKGNRNYSVTGYFAKKLVNPDNTLVKAASQIETYPFPVIRLADLYLLYAECLNEANSGGTPPADCYTYIDLVRARAGFPDGVISDWAAHSTNPDKPNSYLGFREIVRQERMIELALESQRFWDIRRWGLATQYFNGSQIGWDIEQPTTDDYYQLRTYHQRQYLNRDNLWPLRNYDLVVNPNLVQNPGW